MCQPWKSGSVHGYVTALQRQQSQTSQGFNHSAIILKMWPGELESFDVRSAFYLPRGVLVGPSW